MIDYRTRHDCEQADEYGFAGRCRSILLKASRKPRTRG
jgi:hypothetical protein